MDNTQNKASKTQAILAIVTGVVAMTDDLSVKKTAVIITGMLTAAIIEYALCVRPK